MNTEDLTKFLEESKDEIAGAIKAKIIASMTERVQWDLPDLIRKDVIQFYTDEVQPEIRKYLTDNKAALMQTVIKACVDASDAVAKAMAERIQKTMANEYDARKLWGALFDVPGRY